MNRDSITTHVKTTAPSKMENREEDGQVDPSTVLENKLEQQVEPSAAGKKQSEEVVELSTVVENS